MLERSCGPDWLDAKLSDRELLIIDGAMGTELEARGVPMHGQAWSASAIKTHPDVVRNAHTDYIRAGAEVIITNTFSSGRHMLEQAGLGEEVRNLNLTAVELAKQARAEAAGGPIAIAGSICDWVYVEGKWCQPDNLSAALREQAELLAEAGVDIIALEMCQTEIGSPLAVEAALATGLPVWLGLSCMRHEGGGDLATFDDPTLNFEAWVDRFARYDIAMINVMHSPIKDVAEGIAAVKRHWQGPIGVYPESGYFIMPNWQFVDVIAPTDLVREARVWVDLGVQALGGCCGLGPQHVRALFKTFG